MNINDLIERVSQYDNSLAKDLSEYVRGREYGLVYEASKPEFVRLWNKPVVRGDLVNILPPRGVMEDIKGEDSPSCITYRYISKCGDKAKLRNIKTQEECEVSVEDLVAIARFDQPIYCGLKEKDRVERGGDKPYHVVINGENYHALQTLAYAYAGKVDCIYIDPPYNTGAKDWKYNNDYVSGDDVYRHSKWLTFMEDRLRIAKKLLNPKDSVLIVTIDEKEYLRLGMLLEQMFPEGRIQMISSLISPQGNQRKQQFSRIDEYIFFVEIGDAAVKKINLSDEWRVNAKDTRTTHLHWQQLIRNGSIGERSKRPNLFYPVYLSLDGKKFVGTGEPLPLEMSKDDAEIPEDVLAIWPMHKNGVEGHWGLDRRVLEELQKKGYVKLGPLKNGNVYITYLQKGMIEKVENGEFEIDGYNEDGSIISSSEVRKFVPGSQWRISTHDATRNGSNLLQEIFKDRRFSFPKSVYATHDAIKFFTDDKPDALIVDFFAGSGTTLHAVNILNSEDNGKRRCICITNNEVSVDEQKTFTQKKLRQGDEEWERYGIAEYVTWPRTKCTIEGHDIKNQPLSGKYYGTDKPMEKGFDSNAIYYELNYLEPSIVGANLAFNEISPILWLRSGCKGSILKYQDKYAIGDTYAILFDYAHVARFVEEVHKNKEIQHIFIVTDTKNRYRSMCAEFPGRDVVQLYESYLRSFEINTEV